MSNIRNSTERELTEIEGDPLNWFESSSILIAIVQDASIIAMVITMVTQK